MKRDLLNVVLGNVDNHGRNIAILKDVDSIRLAPVYDLAPMRMDEEMITRTSRWESAERGANIDWRAVCRSVNEWAPEEAIWAELRELGERLRDLDERLEAAGLPRQTLEYPSIGFARINQRLNDWGLI